MPPFQTSSLTGKYTVLTTINEWLLTNVPPAAVTDFVYRFTNRVSPTPSQTLVSVNEFTFFSPASGAWNEMLFAPGSGPVTPNPTYEHVQGQKNQLMLEINIYTKNQQLTNDKFKLYRMRDKLRYALINAGKSDDAGHVLFPPIAMASTNIVARVPIEEDNHILEHYYPPSSEMPDTHRYQMLVKFQWYELF